MLSIRRDHESFNELSQWHLFETLKKKIIKHLHRLVIRMTIKCYNVLKKFYFLCF